MGPIVTLAAAGGPWLSSRGDFRPWPGAKTLLTSDLVGPS